MECCINNLPHFWLIQIPQPRFYLERSRPIIERSLLELEFSFERIDNDIYKIWHFKPKMITLWLLKHGNMLSSLEVKVMSYIHNTKISDRHSRDFVL